MRIKASHVAIAAAVLMSGCGSADSSAFCDAASHLKNADAAFHVAYGDALDQLSLGFVDPFPADELHSSGAALLAQTDDFHTAALSAIDALPGGGSDEQEVRAAIAALDNYLTGLGALVGDGMVEADDATGVFYTIADINAFMFDYGHPDDQTGEWVWDGPDPIVDNWAIIDDYTDSNCPTE